MAELPGYDQLDQGRTWGLFGDDGERGLANFAGPEQVVAAARLVRRGATFNLDHALDAFNPPMARKRGAPVHELLSAHAEQRDDVLREFYLQATSQVDGLRHRRASGMGFYDGVADDQITVGNPALGVQRWAEQPIVSRGVVVDIEGLLAERGTPLDHRQGPALEASLLDEALQRQGVTLQPGDIVLVHTGWARWFLAADVELRAEVRDARRATGFVQRHDLPRWIWEHRVALFATDTFAVEVLPVSPESEFRESAPEDLGMMHQELIAKLGAPIGELWQLDGLVADSRATGQWDCLCVVKPLNLVGGVGSPPNATALR